MMKHLMFRILFSFSVHKCKNAEDISSFEEKIHSTKLGKGQCSVFLYAKHLEFNQMKTV